MLVRRIAAPLAGMLAAAAILAAGYRMAYAGTAGGREFIWLGLLTAVASFVIAVQKGDIGRLEMAWLVVAFAAVLFLPKLFRAPSEFIFFDELQHVRSTEELLNGDGVGAANPMNPLLADYPGLHLVTGAVAKLFGLSIFTAGNIVILVARIAMLLALYALFVRLTASRVIAGLAVAIYAANPAYLFFDAQFSYESLALPLATIVLALGFAREGPNAAGTRWRFALAVVLEVCVVATHHITSYALAIVLLTFALCIWLLESERRGLATRLGALGAIGAVLSAAWFAAVAPNTFDYLSGGITGATSSISDFFSQQGARQPFAGSPFETPVYERAMSMGAVALLGLAFVYGALLVRKTELRGRHLACVVLGSAYFLSLPLQLTQEATSTPILPRIWEFAFLGLAPIAAIALHRLATGSQRWFAPAAVAAVVVIAVMGGSIIRSGENIRLPGDYIPSAGPRASTADTIAAATWLDDHYGPHLTVMGDYTLTSVFGGYGRARPASYQDYGFRPWLVFYADSFTEAGVAELRRSRTQFVAVDRRVTRERAFTGWYFSPEEPRLRERVMPEPYLRKFADSPMFSSVYDNGNVAIYRYVGPRGVSRLRIAGDAPRVSARGSALVQVACSAGRSPCTADVSLVDLDPEQQGLMSRQNPGRSGLSVLGRTAASVPPGRTVTLKIPLSEPARNYLRRRGSLNAEVHVDPGEQGLSRSTVTDVKISLGGQTSDRR